MFTLAFQQLREVWTKDFKSSPAEEDDVEEDDVEMTGEVSGTVSHVDEDSFEKEIRLANETSEDEVRVSTVPRYVKQVQSGRNRIFQYWAGRLPGHAHVNHTYPDVVRMWKQFHG